MMYLGENTNHGQISLDTPLKKLPLCVCIIADNIRGTITAAMTTTAGG